MKAVRITEELLQIRTRWVNFYVLREGDSLYLIDTGFFGACDLLMAGLEAEDWNDLPIAGILLTHGHIDHVWNVSGLVEDTGAWVAGPLWDEAHYAGKNQYEGVARMTGWAEAFARKTRGYRPFDLHRTLDADVDWRLPLDLKVVPLPGHTRGHLGLYWERKKWLFSGDLFASFRGLSHLPPVFFNENTKEARASIGRALELDLAGVLPNHCDQASPEEHLKRLRCIRSKDHSGR